MGDEIENWSSQNGEDVTLERIIRRPLEKLSCLGGQNPPPYRDIFHFTGISKPWEMDLRNTSRSTPSNRSTGKRLSKTLIAWKQALLEVQEITNYSFSFHLSHERGGSNPPVGRFATFNDMIRHIRAKSFFGWNQYESAA